MLQSLIVLQPSVVIGPNTWFHSSRVSRVRIVPMKKPDCALTIENNWFHVWSLTKAERPVASEKVKNRKI